MRLARIAAQDVRVNDTVWWRGQIKNRVFNVRKMNAISVEISMTSGGIETVRVVSNTSQLQIEIP